MSGVEILANGLLGALHDSWVQTPQHWQTALLSCLPVLLICLALRRLSPRKSFLATMVVLMGIFISSWLLMPYGRVWVPITARANGEIGRAQCRDRWCQDVSLSVVAGSLK